MFSSAHRLASLFLLSLFVAIASCDSTLTTTFYTLACTTSFGNVTVKSTPRSTIGTTTHTNTYTVTRTTTQATVTPPALTATASSTSTSTTTTTLATVTDTFTQTATDVETITTSTTDTVFTTTSVTSTTVATSTASTTTTVFCTLPTPILQMPQVLVQNGRGRNLRLAQATPSSFPQAVTCRKTETFLTRTIHTATIGSTVTAATPHTTVTRTSIVTSTATITPEDASTTLTTTTESSTTSTLSFTETSTITKTLVATSVTSVTSTSTACATNVVLQAGPGSSVLTGQYGVFAASGDGYQSQFLDFTSDISAANIFNIDSSAHLTSSGYYANQDSRGHIDPIYFNSATQVSSAGFLQPSCSVSADLQLNCSETDGRSSFEYCVSGNKTSITSYTGLASQVTGKCFPIDLFLVLR